MAEAKSYEMSKRVVWEAYKKVKANRGAAGVDGESLEAFEQDLKNNLTKLWNRMSSGSYFPPPVRLVEIPKGNTGATRPLGIPTVSDRMAQMVVKRMLEPQVEGSLGFPVATKLLKRGRKFALLFLPIVQISERYPRSKKF